MERMSSRCCLRGRTRVYDVHTIPLQVFMIEGFLIEQEQLEKERYARLPVLNWRKKA
jgi:hypothetical protein